MKKNIFLAIFGIITLLTFQNFLMPDQAFQPSASLKKNTFVVINVKLGKEIYLHKKDFKISMQDDQKIYIKNIKLSKSVTYDKEQVFTHSVRAIVQLAKKADVSGEQKIDIILSFQGCSKQGICYRPQLQHYTFTLDADKLRSNAPIPLEMTPQADQKLSQTETIAHAIGSKSVIVTLLMFLGFGLLLAFTPCIFPMIPILSSIIVSQGKGITTKSAFMLSLVYVLSMAVAYTIAGVLAGLFGENLQASLQTPWVIYSFSAIFVLLSLSMFGLYELQMPNFIQSKLSAKTGNKTGIFGVAIMGFLSALIVGPCIAAPLAGALVYIGQTGNAVLGGAALFALALGMGIPLLIVGTGAGKFMPRPGKWMDLVKAIFGFMMLGVAIWMLSRIVTPYMTMLLYSLLALATAVYLGALEPLHLKNGVRENSVKKIIAVLIFLYGLLLFIGVLSGSNSYTTPLDGFSARNGSTPQTTVQKPHFQIVTSIAQLNALLAKEKGKRVLVDFSAKWCVACKELEDKTFSDPNVIQAMNQFILVRADLTANTAQEKALANHYKVFGPPAIIFFDKNAKMIPNKTIVGYITAEKFLTHLKSL